MCKSPQATQCKLCIITQKEKGRNVENNLVSKMSTALGVIYRLGGFCCCDRTPWSRAIRGGKGLFHLKACKSEGSQGKKPEAGTWSEATEECCSLTCSHDLLKTTCLGVTLPTVVWALLHHSVIAKTYHRQIWGGGHFLDRDFFPPHDSSLLLTKLTGTHGKSESEILWYKNDFMGLKRWLSG